MLQSEPCLEPIASERELTDYLSREQAMTSAACIGERFCSSILSKASKRELIDLMERTHVEGVACDLLEYVIAAQESLMGRLKLVDCAFARLAILAKEHRETSDD